MEKSRGFYKIEKKWNLTKKTAVRYLFGTEQPSMAFLFGNYFAESRKIAGETNTTSMESGTETESAFPVPSLDFI